MPASLLAYSFAEIAALAAVVTAFPAVAVPLGELVLRLAERFVTGRARPGPPDAGRLGAALLAGLASVSTIGVALGLAGALVWPLLALVGAGAVVLARREAADYRQWMRTWPGALRSAPTSRWFVAGAAAAASLFAFQIAVALAPPAATDEIAYHVPQAELLAQSGRLESNVDGHFLYGNTPKLVELLYAEALVFSAPPAAAHLLHVALFGGALLLIFGAVRRFFGAGAGLAAVLLLLLYDELTRNATLAYVDAATAGFELAAVFSAAAWVVGRGLDDLAAAALFAGAAAGAKYSGAPTLLFVGVIGLAAAVHVARRSGQLRAGIDLVARLAVVAGVFCGYWYVKNLLVYGNPTYPFLFGHEGVDSATYAATVDSVRGAGSSSFLDYLQFPEAYARVSELPVHVALYLFPLAFLVRRSRPVIGLLAGYVVAYSAYWFFLGSHNTRFVMSAAATALILCAIALVRVPRVAVPVLTAAAVVSVADAFVRAADLRTATWNELAVKTRPDEVRFLLRGADEEAFLQDVFGCHYDALVHLRRARARGAVAVAPVVGPDHELDYYSPVEIETLPEEPDEQRRALAGGRYRYLLVRPSAATDERLVRGARLVWSQDDCRLYELA